MSDWILIDKLYRYKLPNIDCDIWITRVCCGNRFVQKVHYYSKTKDIQWDGTIAWKLVDNKESKPEPCMEDKVTQIQLIRILR